MFYTTGHVQKDETKGRKVKEKKRRKRKRRKGRKGENANGEREEGTKMERRSPLLTISSNRKLS